MWQILVKLLLGIKQLGTQVTLVGATWQLWVSQVPIITTSFGVLVKSIDRSLGELTDL